MPVEEAVDSRPFYFSLAVLIALSAVALVSAGLPDIPPVAGLVVFLFLAIAQLGAVPLPGGGSVSAAPALEIAALVVIGPVPTAWVGAVSRLAIHAVVRRRRPSEALHDVASGVLSVLAAGAAFAFAGGATGALTFPAGLAPLAVASLTHFAVHSACASLLLGWTTSLGPWRAWQRIFGRSLLFHLSGLAVGGWIATTVLSVGAWSLLLFAPPLFAAYRALRVYIGFRGDLRDFVRALAGVLDEVDPYTRQHSMRVAEYALRLARAMGCSESELDDLECAALVHDLGKIGPQHQRILQKVGTLSHEDQRTLRSHPATGAGIVGKVEALRCAAEIVRLHHERPDGRGYPLGLRSEEVPIGARILNVADAFDAMTSDRPYRRALDVDAALREIDRGAGTQFDRGVVDCLLRLHGSGRFVKIDSPTSEELLRLKVRRPVNA